LRHIESSSVANFLQDANPVIVAEAARAINDIPIVDALPDLAYLIDEPDKILAFPVGDVDHPGPRDAVLRRVLNANSRVGDSNSALALATFAAATTAPEKARAEAIALLADWEKPSGRDRITGLWRPLPKRDATVAADALQPFLGELQKSKSNPIKLAATKAAGVLNITAEGFDALDVVKDKSAPSNVRVEALRSLANQNDARLAEAVNVALTDENEQVRKAATTIHAQLDPDEALAQLSKVLSAGTTAEKQNAFATLGSMNLPASDAILAEWANKLVARAVAPELQLDVLDAAAKKTNMLVKSSLERFERSRPANDDLRSYRECLFGGNAEEGRRIFFERPEASCVRCHKYQGEGGEVAPDVTLIGATKNREYLLESITFPNKHIAPGFENVIVTLKNGTTYAGIIKSETKDTLEINSGEDGIVRMRISDIKRRERGLSGMPEELRQVLSKHDLRDLVEFLAAPKQALNTPAMTAPASIVAPPAPARALDEKPNAVGNDAVQAQKKLREALEQAPRTAPAPAAPAPQKRTPPAE
ncbi:MAG TPA: hypothetical protein VK530_14330, partial [Candidatus Acidoferrum sp.]|nr:hypothetical protein [Candidatus Acidoferrum sp.]